MIASLYLASPRLDAQINAAAHLRSLAAITGEAVTSSHTLFDLRSLRRTLQAENCPVLYLLAHSEGSRGMAVGREFVDGPAFAASLPGHPARLLRIILFNTCDAVASNLVGSALDAGVSTVVAAERPIRIDAMCAYAETLIRTWTSPGVPIVSAVKSTNLLFAERGVEFRVFGDQFMASLPELLFKWNGERTGSYSWVG